LVAIESSGAALWRFVWTDAWDRSPDTAGCLCQSSGMTCGPVAAAMLLHRQGIRASEGEVAYWAGTSFFGTDAWSLARALARLGQSQGLRPEVGLASYESCREQNAPFVAYVRVPDLGGHAWFVQAMTWDFVELVDPLDGHRRKLSREQFQSAWDGTAVWLVR
jgi:ABC-type bacteriocin/lantibiotic exporter with double-glycine peptidase domain